MMDEKYMRRAIKLALQAKGETSPNPMVGSVIVRGKEVIAEGWHKRCGDDHAEIIALKKAGLKAKGATMYVSLEPCFHFGRTPPCVDAVIKSGIKKVVVAMKDPNPETSGKSIAKLRRAGIAVKVGACRKEAQQLNEIFLKYITEKMPFVVAKSAQSIDAKISAQVGYSPWITSKKTRDFAKERRAQFDAIMVGINTVLADDPQLNALTRSRPIKKIVVDSNLRISFKAKLLKGADLSDCIIATTQKASERKIKMLQNKGVEVIICPKNRTQVCLRTLLKTLAKIQITSILLEGGSTLIQSALRENLVDKVNVYVAPKILGEKGKINSFIGLSFNPLKSTIRLKDISIKSVNSDLLVEGYI